MNMNKKGFTLTEMLAVVVIISLIALIAVPNVQSLNESIKQRKESSAKELVVNAAVLYVQDGNATCTNECSVSISTLLEADYLEEDEIGILKDTEGNYPSILVKSNGNNFYGIYGGTITNTSSNPDFVVQVCSMLNSRQYTGKNTNGHKCDCDTNAPSENEVCLVTGRVANNYVRFPNGTPEDIIWRIMGVKRVSTEGNINEQYNVLLVTDDNIITEFITE